jgi:hypothetical protein
LLNRFDRDLFGIQSLIKDKGLKLLYVLEVATDGWDVDWSKRKLTEANNITVMSSMLKVGEEIEGRLSFFFDV